MVSTMNIVDTISQQHLVAAPRQRRSFSRQFKAQVVAECADPSSSVAGVALRHGLNANLVHKWKRLAERRTGGKEPAAAFVPLMVAPQQQSSAKPVEIRIEVQRGAGRVVVSWPVEAAGECAAWLRDWLR